MQQRPHLAWTPALLLLGGLSFLVDIAGIGRALVPAAIASAAAAARSGPRTRASTASTAGATGATGATSAGATSTGTATARAAAITTGVVTRAMGANQAVDGRRQHHVRGKAMRSERLQKQVPHQRAQNPHQDALGDIPESRFRRAQAPPGSYPYTTPGGLAAR